jgi:hypothetical protein
MARNKASSSNETYNVQVNWPTVVPLGDTLSIHTHDGFDDRWVEAFEVVVDEHERQETDTKWRGIDFDYSSGENEVKFVLFVKGIEPGVTSFELRRTVDDLVMAANAVAQVGTHVYELARELRQPVPVEPAAPRGSTPPPGFDPIEDELQAEVA